jgi:lipoprotein-anchoring transpeptidase ErfK/SrfK
MQITAVLTPSLGALRRYGPRLGALLATFIAVSGISLIQQQREASAMGNYQAAHLQVLDERARAEALGLEASEFADLWLQEEAASNATAPSAIPPFNQSRIAFFVGAWKQELELRERLQTRASMVLSEAHGSAHGALGQLNADLAKAKDIGVEEELLTEFGPAVTSAQAALDRAATIHDYRGFTAKLKEPAGKLAQLIEVQQATNQVISQYAAEAALKDQGDAGLARAGADALLSQVNANLQLAGIFRLDVSAIAGKVQKLAAKLPGLTAAGDIDHVTGALMLNQKNLQQVMNEKLPEKALTVSLTEQVLRAYEKGKEVFWTYVTTGRPGLETDQGVFKVNWKVAPWTMQSPWPKGSSYWYPDTKVQMVMWFNGAEGIHDASWRSVFGPGTQYPHYDPAGPWAETGTHGCVGLPTYNMTWIWNWTPTGTPVIVY